MVLALINILILVTLVLEAVQKDRENREDRAFMSRANVEGCF